MVSFPVTSSDSTPTVRHLVYIQFVLLGAGNKVDQQVLPSTLTLPPLVYIIPHLNHVSLFKSCPLFHAFTHSAVFFNVYILTLTSICKILLYSLCVCCFTLFSLHWCLIPKERKRKKKSVSVQQTDLSSKLNFLWAQPNFISASEINVSTLNMGIYTSQISHFQI